MEIELITDLMDDYDETESKNKYLKERLKASILVGDVYDAQGVLDLLIQSQHLLEDINSIINSYSILN